MPDIGKLIGLFFLAAVLRAAYALACYWTLGPEGVMGPDSHAFLRDAQFLADGGSFLQVAPAFMPGFPNVNMPVPFWLMSLTLQAGSTPDPLAFVLVQGVIDAATCLIIGWTAERLKPGLFVPAALLAAINPTQIVVAGMFYTDTLFLFFVTAGMAATLSYMQDPSYRKAALVGLFWGMALMCRPFVQIWLLLLPLLLLVGFTLTRRYAKILSSLPQIAVMAAIVLGCASPIMLRNMAQFGTAQLSPQAGDHLLFWVVPLAREYGDGTPRAVSKARGDNLYETWKGTPPPDGEFAQSARMTEIAISELADMGVGTVALAWIKGAVMNLSAPASTIAPPVSALPRSGFYETPGKSLSEKVWNYLFHNKGAAYATVLLLSGLTMPVWILLGVGGFVLCLRSGRETMVLGLLLFLWAGYTFGINGPVVSPKYRLPLEPVWVVFATIALCQVWAWVQTRRRGLA